ncbi:MAG: c-type cytochrome biogenesis protein CcmI [Pseudomonadota bacterium]
MAAILTVAATLCLLIPLARSAKTQTEEREYDAEVYHDQLREIDRDIDAGLLSGEQAEYARAEVGRRLLKATKETGGKTKSGTTLAGAARYVVIVFLPVMAVAAYLAIGSPDMPAQPLAARIQADPEDSTDIASLVVRAETHLASNPDDGRGWEVLAPIYFNMGRMEDSETAYRNAIRLLGPSAERHAGLGQAMFAQTGGIVTAEVQTQFQAADALEPDNPLSAFFLALGLAQEGQAVEARTRFRALAARSAPNDPWMPQLRQQIAELDRTIGSDGEGGPAGPDMDQIAAAEAMSAAERREMIGGMVAGLDARLRENPDDIEGWLQLLRSYMVLGQTELADDALQRAMQHFAAGTTGRQALTQAATQFGIGPEKADQ